jgi:hypothetical protein
LIEVDSQEEKGSSEESESSSRDEFNGKADRKSRVDHSVLSKSLLMGSKKLKTAAEAGSDNTKQKVSLEQIQG